MLEFIRISFWEIKKKNFLNLKKFRHSFRIKCNTPNYVLWLFIKVTKHDEKWKTIGFNITMFMMWSNKSVQNGQNSHSFIQSRKMIPIFSGNHHKAKKKLVWIIFHFILNMIRFIIVAVLLLFPWRSIFFCFCPQFNISRH